MRTNLSILLATFLLAIPCASFAQSVGNGSNSTTVKLSNPFGLNSYTGDKSKHPDLDHMGSFNVYAGKVCFDNLSLANDTTNQKEAERDTYTNDKTTGKFVKTASAVEVLQPGDSIDLLLSPSSETRVYRASGGPLLNLDKATPILQGTFSHGITNCEANGGVAGAMLVTEAASQVSVTIALVDDAELLELMPVEDVFSVASSRTYGVRVNRIDMAFTSFPKVEINGITTDVDGHLDFTLSLIVPVAVDRG